MGNQSGRLIIIGDDATPNQVLVAASDFLERWGWQRGALGGGKVYGSKTKFNPACALGAIEAVTTNTTNRTNLRNAAQKLLRSRINISIMRWNDAPRRTANEVIATMREAAGIS